VDNHYVRIITIFAVIFALESISPFFKYKGLRLKHGIKNLALSGLNYLVGMMFAGIIAYAVSCYGKAPLCIIRNSEFNPILLLIATVIIFDLWMYTWHRLNHEFRILWRFHRVHHTDLTMDATTVLRFHPIEIAISHVLNVVIMLAVGITLSDAAFYEMLMFPVICFHHSNVALPAKIDRILKFIIVTPNMHRVHHSQILSKSDDNFSLDILDAAKHLYEEVIAHAQKENKQLLPILNKYNL